MKRFTRAPDCRPLTKLLAGAVLCIGICAESSAATDTLDLRPPSCSMAPGMSAVYPQAAIDAKIFEGSVALSFFVAPTGQIHDVKVESASDPIFTANALHAINQLHCDNPANIEMPTHFTVEFHYSQPH